MEIVWIKLEYQVWFYPDSGCACIWQISKIKGKNVINNYAHCISKRNGIGSVSYTLNTDVELPVMGFL